MRLVARSGSKVQSGKIYESHLTANKFFGSAEWYFPQLQLRFEQIKQLPRQQQEFVLDFLDTC
jgi:hypothetical protein